MKKTVSRILLGIVLVLLVGCSGKEVDNDIETSAILKSTQNNEVVTTTDDANEKNTIDYAEICRSYISKNQNQEIENITNWDNPTITSVDKLPNKYYLIQEKENIEKVTSVTFNTTSDEILGPICFYVDSDGTILGSNYRK